MHRYDNWSFVVVRFKKEDRGNILWKISDFLEQTKEVISFHFRYGHTLPTENMFYVCFRIFREVEDKETIERSIKSMLERIGVREGNFMINPKNEDIPFNQFVKFSQPDIDGGVHRWGGENNWKEYMLVLARLSRIVADLAKKGLFDSAKRAEVLHLFANMSQLHEIGLSQIFGGYQDFINIDEIYPYS